FGLFAVKPGVVYMGAKPFSSEVVPFGIANGKFQIPNMKSEICDLKFRASARKQVPPRATLSQSFSC
ncbi:MAG: hypothetical protein ACXW6T_26985, partial [Candidatus Binatia bacterium]